jgi:hypothetical protein
MKKVALIVLSLILLVFLLLNILLDKKPGEGTFKNISGTFHKLETIQPKKGGYSFDLYLIEYSAPFKIGAGDIYCFKDYLFTEDVKYGESVILKVEDLSWFKNESITKIYSRGRHYMDSNCMAR